MQNNDDYIEHYGIMGMQWGVQNGPPYPLDEKDKNLSELRYYDPKTLSMSDLQDRIKRYEAENRYQDLANKRNNPMLYDIGNLMSKYGDQIFKTVFISTLAATGAAYMKKQFNLDVKTPEIKISGDK